MPTPTPPITRNTISHARESTSPVPSALIKNSTAAIRIAVNRPNRSAARPGPRAADEEHPRNRPPGAHPTEATRRPARHDRARGGTQQRRRHGKAQAGGADTVMVADCTYRPVDHRAVVTE